ncbi:MAG: transporter associated domain-containing protein [Polyangiaceae bacterium]
MGCVGRLGSARFSNEERGGSALDPAPPPHQALSLVDVILTLIPALTAAVFSAASAGMNALTTARIGALAEKLGGAGGAALLRYRAHGSAIRSRWLVCRVLGIAATAILAARWVPLEGPKLTLGATLLALALYGVPAEIFRGLAERTAERSAPLLLRILRPIELLITPLALPFYLLGRIATGSVDRPTQQEGVTETEVEIIVKEGEENGSLGHEQSEMIRNVLDFSDLMAADVMVPRTRVTTLPIDCPLEEVLRIVGEKGHSRYPVVRDRVDNVVGLLHVKDLIRFLSDNSPDDFRVEHVTRKPVAFVPEGQACSSVLADMRAGRHHMAVVIDEFGGMSGIVTLEDLIEEIVGDIRDEHDQEEAPIVDLGDGRLMVNASVPIGDLSRYLGVEFEDGDYHSLGGFIIDRLGRVPGEGSMVSEFGLDFIVREADERHVMKVEIIREAPSPDSLMPRSSSRSQSAA